MRTYFLKRNKVVSADATKMILEKINNFKNGEISIFDIEIPAFGDTFNINAKLNEYVDSFTFFNSILKIGKIIEDNLVTKKTTDKGRNYIDYYQNCIAETLTKEIDKISEEIPYLFSDYGYFVFYNTLTHKENAFNLFYFVYFCYLTYETFTLFKCVVQFKTIKLKLFLNYYDLQLKPLRYYETLSTEMPEDIKPSERKRARDNKINKIDKIYEYIANDIEEDSKRNKIFKIIENRMETLQRRNNVVRFQFSRDFDIDKLNNEKAYNDRFKTEMIFTNPLAIVVYELKVQLTNDTETSLAICQNEQCSNTFKTNKNKNTKYCGKKKCDKSRARQRKQDSLNNQKKKKLVA